MQAPHTTPAGAGGTAIVQGKILNEEHNRKLLNERAYGEFDRVGVLEKMRRTDPHVWRSLKLVKLPIQATTWSYAPVDESPLQVEIAEFCSWAMFKRLPWSSTLRQLLNMKDFGFSLFEVLEEMAEVPADRFPLHPSPSRGVDGALTKTAFLYSSLEPRLPRTIDEWRAKKDRSMEVETVVQWIGFTDTDTVGRRSMSFQNLLRFTNEQEGGNFQGRAILRTIYKTHTILEMLEKIDAIRHERQNVGIAKITLPEESSDADEQKANEILAALASNEKSYLVLPHGWSFEWDTSGQGKGTDVLARITDLKRDIADNVLAGFMTLGNGDTGSYALAETQADQYLQQLEECVEYIEETLTTGNDGVSFTERLVDRNYGPQAEYPRAKAGNLRTRDFEKLLQLVIQLINTDKISEKTQVDVERFIRKDFGFAELPAEELVVAEKDTDEPPPADAPPGETDDPPAEPANEDPPDGEDDTTT